MHRSSPFFTFADGALRYVSLEAIGNAFGQLPKLYIRSFRVDQWIEWSMIVFFGKALCPRCLVLVKAAVMIHDIYSKVGSAESQQCNASPSVRRVSGSRLDVLMGQHVV